MYKIIKNVSFRICIIMNEGIVLRNRKVALGIPDLLEFQGLLNLCCRHWLLYQCTV